MAISARRNCRILVSEEDILIEKTQLIYVYLNRFIKKEFRLLKEVSVCVNYKK